MPGLGGSGTAYSKASHIPGPWAGATPSSLQASIAWSKLHWGLEGFSHPLFLCKFDNILDTRCPCRLKLALLLSVQGRCRRHAHHWAVSVFYTRPYKYKKANNLVLQFIPKNLCKITLTWCWTLEGLHNNFSLMFYEKGKEITSQKPFFYIFCSKG